MTDLMKIDTAQLKQAESSIAPYINEAPLIKVVDPITNDRAGVVRKELVNHNKQVKSIIDYLVAPFKAGIKQIQEMGNNQISKTAAAIDHLDRELIRYDSEQKEKVRLAEAKRREEEAKLLAKRREEERKLQEKEDALRKKAEEEAEALKAKGKTAQAQVKLEQANQKADELWAKRNEMAQVPVEGKTIIPEIVKGSAVKMVTRWKAEVIDKMTFVLAVATGDLPLEAIDYNEAVLNEISRTQKQSITKFGVKFYSETKPAGK